MGKKKRILNNQSSQRLSDWLSEIDMTQNELAEAIDYSVPYVSNIMTGKRAMTLDFAQRVSEKTAQPSTEYNIIRKIRPEYLLCLDDIRTTDDLQKLYDSLCDSRDNSAMHLLESSWDVVCLNEGMERPPVLDIEYAPELLFLQAQLKDFSDSLMRNYLKRYQGKPSGETWNFLDQLSEKSSK